VKLRAAQRAIDKGAPFRRQRNGIDAMGLIIVVRYADDLVVGFENRTEAGVLSFVLDGYRTEDVGAALNRQGIAVRAGHHCAQPILRRFGVESTVRPSLALVAQLRVQSRGQLPVHLLCATLGQALPIRLHQCRTGPNSSGSILASRASVRAGSYLGWVAAKRCSG